MARFIKKDDKKAGLPPGSLIFVGQQKVDAPRIRVIRYGEHTLTDDFLKDQEELACSLERFEEDAVCWVNIDGLHETGVIEHLGTRFSIPALVLEDILNTGQRPKLEDHPEYVFVTLKLLYLNESETLVHSEQLSLLLKDKLLITFQERPGDVFEPVRDRIRRKSGKIRSRGADYLLYALLDSVLENYLKVIEALGESIEDLEEDILDRPGPLVLEEISAHRRENAYLRKAIRPVREIVTQLAKVDSGLIGDGVQPYLRTLSDMERKAAEAVEIYKELLSDHLMKYNMALGNRLNDIMKFLTVFSTIFIPLSFLAGVYGMNFQTMPGLAFPYGFHVLLGCMGALALGMLLYFKLKKWF